MSLLSCTTVTLVDINGQSKTRTTEEFKIYVEEVFRRQNNAILDVGLMLDDITDPESAHKLELAEKQLLSACEPVNEAAIRQSEQKSVSWVLQLEVKNSITECDHATHSLNEIIKSLQ